ncbi:MAG TPA: GNAT family N-acetyltransferase [Anaerolineales bacterium]|nr:GNAT family N-acetyltransferase [Anaerolineales bacterium]
MSETVGLIRAASGEHHAEIRNLFFEYAQLIQKIATEEYGLDFTIDDTLNGFMSGMSVFHPPSGSLLLAKYKDEFAGIGCLKRLNDETGEIKRMFVSPRYRRKGLGKVMLDGLVNDARSIGYSKIRLDSPDVFKAAHRLYESMGFRYIEAYEGSEAAESIPDRAVYMELEI